MKSPSTRSVLQASAAKLMVVLAMSGGDWASASGQGTAPVDFIPAPLYPGATPVRSCESLRDLAIPDVAIDAAAVEGTDGSCRVTATVTPRPGGGRIKVWIALPSNGWNGRFRGTGGGGFLGGGPRSLTRPVAAGYAAAATDTGHEGGSGSFALDKQGRLDWPAIRNNAYLGIHEMTVLGKAVTAAFYGKPAKYCYFEGTSTGGRQGLMEAQRYPEDYDGIVSACPAVYWHRFVPVDLWPQVVMSSANRFVPKSKFDAATVAAVKACDALDGVVDGVIDDPSSCDYDPKSLVGTQVDGEILTAEDADVIRRIWNGPTRQDGSFLWYGLSRGTDLSALAGTGGSPRVGKPFGVAHDWFRYFLVQDPAWDWSTLSLLEFEARWLQSVEQYGAVIGTDDPDLSAFRDRKGKIIILHGLADQLIPAGGSIRYYAKVRETLGPTTDGFARLFLAPGVDHGFRGAGPSPVGVTAAITRWVETGEAPERLMAEARDKEGKVLRTRPLFPYPKVAKYRGQGSTDEASNYEAVAP
ncbi:MAG: tannase/feruloyl esterase family alpha/beta hydrolase [Verrucomicrobiales bacterium]|nr:tannase/feruloyl esterase family alpha/beta hydrolase [Verrucomicrobiales bacterium]